MPAPLDEDLISTVEVYLINEYKEMLIIPKVLSVMQSQIAIRPLIFFLKKLYNTIPHKGSTPLPCWGSTVG